MTQPVRDDTRERFLRAIAERVALDRIVSAHLFTPLRQGGAESGLAVIALVAADTADESPHGARHTVLHARYVLQLKGPERGKWDVSIVEEADAPPPTVEDVVRGVHRRAGDGEEPERLAADVFRAALADDRWPTPR